MKTISLIAFSVLLSSVNALAQSSWNMEKIGQLYSGWQSAHDIAITGDYAYAASGEFQVVDISDPENPSEVSYLAGWGLTKDIELIGDSIACIAAYYGGLWIVDITDPENPSMLGQCDTMGVNFYDVAVSGSYAYVTSHNDGLWIIDISDLSSPVIVDSVDVPSAKQVEAAGDYVYVATTIPPWELWVIDVSNPLNAAVTYRLGTGWGAEELVVSGDFLYAATSMFLLEGGLRVVDISNIIPVEVGFFSTLNTSKTVHVCDSIAYLCQSHTLHTVSVADPANMYQIGETEIEPVINAVDATNIYCYLVGGPGGVGVVDISNLSNPDLIDWFGGSNTGWACGVDISQNYAYIANGIREWVNEAAGVLIVNITHPSNPDSVANYPLTQSAYDVAIEQDYAYVANADSGLLVLSVSDPTNPEGISVCSLPGCAVDVEIYGDYAFVAAQDGGLQVVSIADPASPLTAGFLSTTGFTEGIAVHYPYIYIADGYYGGLYIADITDPAAPLYVSSVLTSEYAMDVAIDGNYAYVADGFAGLTVFDVANPAAPIEIGWHETPGYATSVGLLADNHVCLADNWAGLRIFDVTDPTEPELSGYYYTSGTAEGILISDSLAYVAEGSCFAIYSCFDATPVEQDRTIDLPLAYSLMYPYPNPFNPTTVISFSLPVASLVNLDVFDIGGKRVGVGLAPTRQYPPGTHNILFDGTGLASGIYFVRLEIGDFTQTQKLVLMK
ncbi:hypothetical protein CEE37_05245 [candidate division LCP-89 bacterium B3_LCP]|uniref:Secretion system C-terminal sorting domain-containing protein n=1 Tax=candidate division LCP-89 bacterium B3_LCP TaxID=2012998 RepID=A0A532V1I3_UNCL8|nr:MAG: hypothetical protein CEE37_05245 [candidate division LCP-89 bacterium B3_LCP]